MSYWKVVGLENCPVARYVTQVVSETEAEDHTSEDGPLRSWVVEACEGQIQKLIHDPLVVRITWERR